jgi:hypothetical protein
LGYGENFERQVLVGGLEVTGVMPLKMTRTLACSSFHLAFPGQEQSNFVLPHISALMCYFVTGLKVTGPISYGLKPSKL